MITVVVANEVSVGAVVAVVEVPAFEEVISALVSEPGAELISLLVEVTAFVVARVGIEVDADVIADVVSVIFPIVGAGSGAVFELGRMLETITTSTAT